MRKEKRMILKEENWNKKRKKKEKAVEVRKIKEGKLLRKIIDMVEVER